MRMVYTLYAVVIASYSNTMVNHYDICKACLNLFKVVHEINHTTEKIMIKPRNSLLLYCIY